MPVELKIDYIFSKCPITLKTSTDTVLLSVSDLKGIINTAMPLLSTVRSVRTIQQLKKVKDALDILTKEMSDLNSEPYNPSEDIIHGITAISASIDVNVGCIDEQIEATLGDLPNEVKDKMIKYLE